MSQLRPHQLIGAIAVFVLAFVAAAALLHQSVRRPLLLHADMRSEKLVLLDRYRGQVNAAAFGSSHVHNGFDPRAFDAVLSGTPYRTRTLNLAVEGGSQTEQRVLALQFVRDLTPATESIGPPVVLLELNAGANFTNDHLVHPRAINIYDWDTVRFAWQTVVPGMDRKQFFGRRAYALMAWGLHLANFGMLSSRIFSAPLDEKQLTDETRSDRRGFLTPDEVPGAARNVAAEIASMPPISAAEPESLVPANRILAEELQHASAVPGLRVAYFVTPLIADLHQHGVYPPCIQTSSGPVPILELDRPKELAALYHDPSDWTDDAHLSARGAEQVSRLLAQEWLQWNEQGAASARCVS